jgi:hypothetical protein
MKKIKLPNKQELLAAMKVAETSISGADYFAEQFKNILTKTRMMESCSDMMDKVNEFANMVRFKLSSNTQFWSGVKSTTSDVQNMYENLAADAAEKLAGTLTGTLNLDIAINKLSEIVRGYSDAGKAAGSPLVEKLDVLFNSWFTKNHLLSKGSTVYETNEKNEIKTDSEGNPVKADAERVKALMEDPAKGLSKYFSDKGISITIQQHQYPEKALEAGTPEAVKHSTEVRREVKHEETAAVSPDEAPQSGMSSGA